MIQSWMGTHVPTVPAGAGGIGDILEYLTELYSSEERATADLQ